jgi:hypothetical protein
MIRISPLKHSLDTKTFAIFFVALVWVEVRRAGVFVARELSYSKYAGVVGQSRIRIFCVQKAPVVNP